MDIRVKDIAKAVNGKLLCGDAETVIKDVCIDSKIAKEGDLFIPIIGERVDAHKFIDSALAQAAATLTSEHDDMDSEKAYIRVEDTVKALQQIGKLVRDRCRMPVIGVTGSVGKTTTREMISHALEACTQVYHTEGNLNSQVGVPITLFRMNENAEASVIEMGISEPGQMDILSGLVRPDICVVTVIGVAHIEYMKTQENIRREKLSITKSMNPGGALFLNGDDKLLAEVKGDTCVKNTFYYGTADWCDYRAENIRMENYQFVYDYVHGEKRVKVVLNALGRHNVGNSLVGMAIADYLGYDVEVAAAAFAQFKGLRQKIYRVPEKYTIIDDTYNASPDSMKASIDVLSEMESKGKKYIVLGDMFELGDNSKQYHTEVGEYLADKDVDELIVIGELSQYIMNAVEKSESKITCYSFKDNGEVALYLLSVMNPEDIVLIKGSNGMHLNEIVNNIMG